MPIRTSVNSKLIVSTVVGILTTIVLGFGWYLIQRIDGSDTRQTESDLIIVKLQSDLKAAVERTNEARDAVQDGRIVAMETAIRTHDTTQDGRLAVLESKDGRVWQLKKYVVKELNVLHDHGGLPAVIEPDLERKER